MYFQNRGNVKLGFFHATFPKCGMWVKYTDGTDKTEKGMSGSPILNDDGNLIGIHSEEKTGIPVSIIKLFLQAQQEQYGTEEKDKKSCHNTSSIICKTPIVVMPSTVYSNPN